MKRVALAILLLAGSVWPATATFQGPGSCEMDAANSSDHFNLYVGSTTGQAECNAGAILSFARLNIEGISSTIPAGATINSAVCSVYVTSLLSGVVGNYICAYEAWKGYFEDSMCWAYFKDTSGPASGIRWYQLASDGSGHCRTDAGNQNITNGPHDSSGTCVADSADFAATPIDSFLANAGSTWYTFNIDTSLINAWYSGSKNEYGIVFFASTSYNSGFGAGTGGATMSSEEAASGQQPRVVIDYTPGASGQIIMINTE